MNNPRIILYTVLAILVFVVVFYFMGKSLGKSEPPAVVPIPEDTGVGGQPSPSVGEPTIRRVVDGIYEDVYSWWTRDSAPYVELMSFSDSDFVRAYNNWNERYYSKDKETMRQALQKEWFSIFSSTFQNIAKPLMDRFTRLGLS